MSACALQTVHELSCRSSRLHIALLSLTVAQRYMQSLVWALMAIAAEHADRTSRVHSTTSGVVVERAPRQAVRAVLPVPPCWSDHVLNLQR